MQIQQAQPIYQQVYDQIKKLILTGEFKPGSKISVSQLASDYKISRTPLREAFRQLQKDGLLDQSQTGTTVTNINQEDFNHLCACRLLLETEIIKLAVHTISEGDLTVAEDLLNRAEQSLENSEDLKSFLELNAKFHETIIHSVENKRLIQLLEQVRSLLLLYRANIVRNQENKFEIVKEHRNIFNALKERNEAKAIRSIEEHLRQDQKRGSNMFVEETV
ncbi:GntR family transcriptional regulator [Alkalihalobacillus sp. AL-G]|uniref:GntR family transcriptional regulator n=1 Tax=Alkalihalobacillus sp. AL-G TaxID=2926399 RepID=UPI00272BD79C|nr:GntR family transcriptional regulator [Alkalihalobacillus sp. AL-G]WLD94394.1 GntR family transcriptional regulator [Alkalihalobacillus sp. AL-G]